MKYLLFFAISITFLACKKNEGCTNGYALNYNSEAEDDDGSCEFNGKVVLWFNSVTATNMVNASIPNIDLYVNDIAVGSTSANQFSLGEPTCAGEDGLTSVVSLGSETSGAATYKVKKAGTSIILQTGNVAVNVNSCNWVEFTY